MVRGAEDGLPDAVVRPALHELGNAMFGVHSLLQLLAEEDAVLAHAELSQICRRALQESARASALILDLAALVRPAIVRRGPVPFDALVRSVLRDDVGEFPPLSDGRMASPTMSLQGAGEGAAAWLLETDRKLLRLAVLGLLRMVWRAIRDTASDATLVVRLGVRPDAVWVVIDGAVVGGARDGDASPWAPPPPIDGRGVIAAAVCRRLAAIGATLSIQSGDAGIDAWRILLPRVE